MNEEESAGLNAEMIEMKAPATMKGMNFRIQVSVMDCLGCGNCADVCPGNPKAGGPALKMVPLEQELKEAKKLVKKAPAKKAKAPAKKAKAPAKKAKVPAKKEKKKNDKWIKFVKKYAKDNNVSYKQAQKDAGKSYREKYNKK